MQYDRRCQFLLKKPEIPNFLFLLEMSLSTILSEKLNLTEFSGFFPFISLDKIGINFEILSDFFNPYLHRLICAAYMAVICKAEKFWFRSFENELWSRNAILFFSRFWKQRRIAISRPGNSSKITKFHEKITNTRFLRVLGLFLFKNGGLHWKINFRIELKLQASESRISIQNEAFPNFRIPAAKLQIIQSQNLQVIYRRIAKSRPGNFQNVKYQNLEFRSKMSFSRIFEFQQRNCK